MKTEAPLPANTLLKRPDLARGNTGANGRGHPPATLFSHYRYRRRSHAVRTGKHCLDCRRHRLRPTSTGPGLCVRARVGGTSPPNSMRVWNKLKPHQRGLRENRHTASQRKPTPSPGRLPPNTRGLRTSPCHSLPPKAWLGRLRAHAGPLAPHLLFCPRVTPNACGGEACLVPSWDDQVEENYSSTSLCTIFLKEKTLCLLLRQKKGRGR